MLADEINRAPAKVQSALLEVMAERHVSIGGKTFPVPEPFLVLATQNPIESEGVYPLPEAQRDRFLMKVVVGYPTPGEEVEIVHRMGVRPARAPPRCSAPRTCSASQGRGRRRLRRPAASSTTRSASCSPPASPADYGLPDLDRCIAYGASPRASLGLVAAGRALALLRGRSYALPQDVFDVAPDVLRHRLVLSYEALADGPSTVRPTSLRPAVLARTVPRPAIRRRPARRGRRDRAP